MIAGTACATAMSFVTRPYPMPGCDNAPRPARAPVRLVAAPGHAGTLFDKVTGLFDSRFILALLLPVFALAAGIGALAATMIGWHQTLAWWTGLDAARQVALGVAAAAAIVMLAVIAGTQVVAMTRVLEGYWRRTLGRPHTLGLLGRHRERNAAAEAGRGYVRPGLSAESPRVSLLLPAQVLPTRLGNALRAAESYPGDEQRWGLDAVFWWPRLYLILPDSARGQVDDARASVDQLVVLTILSAAFAAVALGLSCALP